ncbi:putative arabinose transporter [Enterobacter cloacae]|uniref:Putative arabinose transporter n=1 Tax=Enterobacter cloacae TaxID=550 RepID=A0A377LWK1_ENTCL|nr:putative arabinose transporter [Enterobacter cloacae]
MHVDIYGLIPYCARRASFARLAGGHRRRRGVVHSRDFGTFNDAGDRFIYCRLSSGLASPALAGAVNDRIAPDRQLHVNTTINAGTSGGIILSVPVLFFMPGGWRAACVVFAIMALLCLPALWRYLPSSAAKSRESTPKVLSIVRKPGMFRLLGIAFISGMASAAWWSFGPEILMRHTELDSAATNILWLISGGAGIIAIFTGSMARRIGMRGVYRLSQIFMAISLAVLTVSHGFSWWLIPAVAMSGAGM